MSIKNQDNQPADICLPAKFVAFLINFYGLFLGGLWALIFIGGVYCMVYAQPGLSAIWNPKTEVVAWFSLLAMLAGLAGVAVGLFWGLRQLRGFGWRFRLAFGVLQPLVQFWCFWLLLACFAWLVATFGRRCPFEGVSLFGDTLSALS